MSELQKDGTEAKPLSRLDEKRRSIHMERRRRAVNKGIPEAEVDQFLAKEDFENLPLETRVSHMIDTAFKRLAAEVVNLQYNDQLLSAAMDVNFRSIAKMLEKVGVSREQQLAFLKEAKEDIERDLEMRKEAGIKAAEAKQVESMKAETEQAGPPSAAPEEATIFGG